MTPWRSAPWPPTLIPTTTRWRNSGGHGSRNGRRCASRSSPWLRRCNASGGDRWPWMTASSTPTLRSTRPSPTGLSRNSKRNGARRRFQALLAKAAATDVPAVSDGLDLPAELARREDRLQALAAAKAEWEARAAARHQTEHPAYDGTMARREAPPGGYNPAWPSAPAAGAGSSRERSEQPDR